MPVVQNPAQWADLITHEEAAAELGIEVKRLRGFMWRNGIGDPIGDATHVYRGSLETLRQRLAERGTAAL